MRLSLLALLATAIALVTSCTSPPDYPDEPVIAYQSASRLFMNQGYGQEDSITLTLSFTDGDGDIGFQQTEQAVNVFVRDLRDDYERLYRLPFVPQRGITNGISGTIDLKLYQTCCYVEQYIPCSPSLPEGTTDEVRYEIYIVDRAGNESNRVQTEAITLFCTKP